MYGPRRPATAAPAAPAPGAAAVPSASSHACSSCSFRGRPTGFLRAAAAAALAALPSTSAAASSCSWSASLRLFAASCSASRVGKKCLMSLEGATPGSWSDDMAAALHAYGAELCPLREARSTAAAGVAVGIRRRPGPGALYRRYTTQTPPGDLFWLRPACFQLFAPPVHQLFFGRVGQKPIN